MMTYIIIFVTVVISIACFNNRALVDKLSLRPFRVVKYKEWYRVITHGFVHGDYTHLIVNMFVLWSFGSFVEAQFKAYAQAQMIGNGDIDYLLLYFGGMIFASAYDVYKRHNNANYSSIGASGAVAAVVFTSIFFNPWGMVYFFAVIPIPGIIFGVFYLMYEQYMSKKGGGYINHNAHFWGAVYGFIFPILLNAEFLGEFISKITFR